ncbi:hypothetical protein [Mesorhizobium sp.]|uniref:hypothetical protein n=1 Tax=Mesorhizobium sp. TaxID=1871066 RepID=UPI00122B8292|nr:hypothetical protein [Mesorhizobium sp.]TIS37533.1 MAG: hypothetical protein E5W95_18140 [Mesorhizobium sp.]
MTNQVDARSTPVYGGYHGEFRKVHKAGWEKVCEGGTPRVYDTAADAENAAWRALRAHLCADIVSTGIERSSTRSAAEKLFGGIFKRGRKIPVERR